MNRLSYTLPADLEAALNSALDEWQLEGKLARLWERDASLWSNSNEADWLGWLTVAGKSLAQSAELESFARDLAARDIRQVVLLGMGGSSMAPEVIAATFGQQPGFPELIVLDSTDPGQVGSVEASIDPAHTAFIVASKSGSSLEPNILMAYFLQRLTDVLGAEQAAQHNWFEPPQRAPPRRASQPLRWRTAGRHCRNNQCCQKQVESQFELLSVFIDDHHLN
jgi:transaldolase/glucose-6-phosphate isomerase